MRIQRCVTGRLQGVFPSVFFTRCKRGGVLFPGEWEIVNRNGYGIGRSLYGANERTQE